MYEHIGSSSSGRAIWEERVYVTDPERKKRAGYPRKFRSCHAHTPSPATRRSSSSSPRLAKNTPKSLDLFPPPPRPFPVSAKPVIGSYHRSVQPGMRHHCRLQSAQETLPLLEQAAHPPNRKTLPLLDGTRTNDLSLAECA